MYESIFHLTFGFYRAILHSIVAVAADAIWCCSFTGKKSRNPCIDGEWEKNNGRGKKHTHADREREWITEIEGMEERICPTTESHIYFDFDVEQRSRKHHMGFEVPKLDQFTDTSISTDLRLGSVLP